MTESTQSRPFDERAFLEELERLADKIQATRRKREQAEAQFETFVKAFRHDRYNELINQHETSLRGSPPPVRIGGSPGVIQPPQVEPPAVAMTSAATSAPRPQPSMRRVAAIAGVAGGLLLAGWLWTSRSTDVPEGPVPSAGVQAPTASTAAALPAPAAPARALSIELQSIRPVWLRVTADGKRVIEREFPAGQTIPVGADRVIAIRAGDGGAVRLSVAGKDQGVLGRDGFPANKTLTAQ